MKIPHKAILSAFILLIIVLVTKTDKETDNIITDQQISATSVDARASLTRINQPITNIPEQPPELNLQSALVKDLGNNFNFLELDINKRWPLASLTKLLTAVAALENLEKSRETDDLIKTMIIASSNEAAGQLAGLYGREEFIKIMQAKADQLEMNQTSISDESGLSFLNQSTVRDLEKLVAYIIKNHPQILQLSRETEVTVNGEKLTSTNRFAGLPEFMGGKTGYTDEANGNLISIFQYQGQPILIIVLGTINKVERFKQTKILLEWISKFYK